MESSSWFRRVEPEGKPNLFEISIPYCEDDWLADKFKMVAAMTPEGVTCGKKLLVFKVLRGFLEKENGRNV